MKKSEYEGLQENIKKLKLPEIEVFENRYNRDYTIHLNFPEFTALCPKTGLPDFGEIEIEYKPAKYCVELRSLKFYFLAYRNVGIFYENAVNKIFDDFIKACSPKEAKIMITYRPRGGISAVLTREYRK